jgi:uncharacterized membrane protein (DUF2068 family)
MSEKKDEEKKDVDLMIWAILAFLVAAGAVVWGIMLLSGRIYAVFNSEFVPFIEASFPAITSFSWWPLSELLFILGGAMELIIGGLFMITGYGIYNIKPWARYLALLCGFILLPAGIGIVILWYFFRKDIKETFAP